MPEPVVPERSESRIFGKKDKKILSQVARASHIIDQVKVLSKYKLDAPDRFMLGAALENVQQIIKKQLQDKNIDFQLFANSLLPYINGNIVSFEQLILNLVLNAKDAILSEHPCDDDCANTLNCIHHRKDNYIHIEVAEAKNLNKMEITISDSGPGIPPEITKDIFMPFFTTKDNIGGTGLGLSICKNIIQDMGGNLTLMDSSSCGSVFKLILPVPKQRY